MKMKKLALCVLSVLALSSMAFGARVASNQQLVDSPIGVTTKGDSVGAGVPFEVRVNVIPKGPELGIFDENGNLYDTEIGRAHVWIILFFTSKRRKHLCFC